MLKSTIECVLRDVHSPALSFRVWRLGYNLIKIINMIINPICRRVNSFIHLAIRGIRPLPVRVPPIKPWEPQGVDGQSERPGRVRRRNVKRFRGGLVFMAHRLLYHSTLGLRVIKKKKKKSDAGPCAGGAFTWPGFRVWC